MSGWMGPAAGGWARRAAVVTIFCLLSATAHTAETLKGVALVIGQSKYEHIPALDNPANDAREMVKLLSDLGFDARSVSDRDAKKLKRDLERFVEDAEGADVAFLYYSGHGIESGGENWLIPVDANVASLGDAQETLVALSSVMDELKSVAPVTVVLLDACRTNPFPADALVKKAPDDPGAPIGAGGLTPTRSAVALATDQPAAAENLGEVIGFAAEPGRPALDGTGENSPYATALLRHLGAMEGVEFGQVMRMVTEEVYLDTKAKQRPWVNESLRRLLYFGVPQPTPTGDDGLITGERRQLLLTISDLPDFNRQQVETAAAKDGVPLDALYGVLRALGAEKIPEDPADLTKLLDAQAERLKAMIAQREALRTDDPEIKRLTDAADRALRQGAIVTARKFLDEAVKRVEANSSAVDAAEEAVKNKRIADAAIYAQRAAASELAFDYSAAAADYRKAFELVERWDDKLRWNYKNLEAEALQAHGDATGDQAALQLALDAYKKLLSFESQGEREVARTRNNMAVVLWTIGERAADTKALEEAATIFRESLAVFERAKDDVNWAAAQNNLGNVLLRIGERTGNAKLSEEAVVALRAALAKRDRAKVPLDWASSQNNLGIALHKVAERTGSIERFAEAEGAYRLALEEYTREKVPVQWAMATNNLAITIDSLAAARNDVAMFKEAAAAFRATLEVRTRERQPLRWAASQVNLAGSLRSIAKLEGGIKGLDEAEAALRQVLEVYTRDASPLDWASTQNSLGLVLQLLGQRNQDAATLEKSAEAFRLAMQENTVERAPLDYAMASYNLGTSLQLAGQIKSDPALLKEAIASYQAASRLFTRENNPQQWALAQVYLGSTLQSLATHENPIETWKEAITARRAGLEVITREGAPLDWANAKSGLGTCLLNLATFDKKPELLPEAQAAFEASEQVFTREAMPLQWAFAQNNIGDVHWGYATQGSGGKPEFEKAIARYEDAKQAFIEAGYITMAPLVDNKINLIKEAMAKL